MLSLPAWAKINLTLEVLGKREDGYHEIASLLQTINLADMLTFKLAEEIKFVCHDPVIREPSLLENQVLKAAKLLQEATGCNKGASIELISAGVPRAAGLGSSASVPAATLKGLNKLWSLGLSSEELSQLAARIGSDAPFFIYGGTALAEGRGEKITPLRSLPLTWLVLLKPAIAPVAQKTASLYGLLTPAHFTSGELTRKLFQELQQGHPLSISLLYNVFEAVAFDFFPGLEDYRSQFLEAGATEVRLAGSGPTLFTLVPDKVQGEIILNRLKERNLEAYLVHSIEREAQF